MWPRRKTVLVPEAMTACLAVIASICTISPTTADIRQSGSWSGAVLQMENATITATISSDVVITPLLRLMHRTCNRNECVFNQGRCEELDGHTNCVVWYSFSSRTPLRKIDMSGDKASISHAVSRLAIVTPNGSIISFSRLRLDSPNDLPPTCYSRDRKCQ